MEMMKRPIAHFDPAIQVRRRDSQYMQSHMSLLTAPFFIPSLLCENHDKMCLSYCISAATQAAHVMLYFRAPLKTTEKQTSILLRDMIANVSQSLPHPIRSIQPSKCDRC